MILKTTGTDTIIRCYAYAKRVDDHHLFLVEIVYNRPLHKVEVTYKSESLDMAEVFISILDIYSCCILR